MTLYKTGLLFFIKKNLIEGQKEANIHKEAFFRSRLVNSQNIRIKKAKAILDSRADKKALNITLTIIGHVKVLVLKTSLKM